MHVFWAHPLQPFLQQLMWRFKSILKPTIWGGSRITAYKALSDVEAPLDKAKHLPIGESLELSALPGAVSVVADGVDAGLTINELLAREGELIMGHGPMKSYGHLFPLLVKILDAGQDLSVQVHPDDSMARRMSLPYGKNEMWYVVDTTSDARLCIGLTRNITASEYHTLVHEARFSEILNRYDARPEQAYYIPAGVVHALGKGCMVIEIQQTCDTTFRIYDYDRRDSRGKPRELHTELAIEALHNGIADQGHIPYPDTPDTAIPMLRSPQFCINRLRLTAPYIRDYSDVDSFRIIIVASGSAKLDDGMTAVEARAGSVWLIAASRPELKIEPSHNGCVILETYIDLSVS